MKDKEYWVLNKLRLRRGQTWFQFCFDFIPYGLSHATVFRAATGRGTPYESTKAALDRYLKDHKEEVDRVEAEDAQ